MVRTEHPNMFSRTFQDHVFKCQRDKLTKLQANTTNNHQVTLLNIVICYVMLLLQYIIVT